MKIAKSNIMYIYIIDSRKTNISLKNNEFKGEKKLK